MCVCARGSLAKRCPAWSADIACFAAQVSRVSWRLVGARLGRAGAAVHRRRTGRPAPHPPGVAVGNAAALCNRRCGPTEPHHHRAWLQAPFPIALTALSTARAAVRSNKVGRNRCFSKFYDFPEHSVLPGLLAFVVLVGASLCSIGWVCKANSDTASL